MRRAKPILVLLALLVWSVPSRPSSWESRGPQNVKIKWAGRTIKIALSTSLTAPSSNFTSGADVIGAAERALSSWSSITDIRFVVTHSEHQSISPAGQGDGINLITIAPTAENIAIFGDSNNAAQTRLFYDGLTGEITEADIAINPFPYSADGGLLQFSTDATPQTYDLESVFAHEIGHLLGLSHSSIVAATMQAGQGLNGTYGLPSFHGRTLSEADQIAVRDLYGPCEDEGSVKGRILNSSEGTVFGAAGAHVWLEDLFTGRAVAAGITNNRGEFSISCMPAGSYRAMVEHIDGSFLEISSRGTGTGRRKRQFRTTEISAGFRVISGKTRVLNEVTLPAHYLLRALQPTLLGTNGDLSTLPVRTRAGTKITIHIEGQGVDLIGPWGFRVSSPLITVDPESLILHRRPDSPPVVTFEVSVAEFVPAGDYSIRLQTTSGEVSYLVGAITVEP